MRQLKNLSLEQNPASQYIPWVIAVTTFVSVLLLIGIFLVSFFIDRWGSELQGHLTVEFTPSLSEEMDDKVLNTKRQEEILQILRAVPGVTRVHLVTQEKIRHLLAPWIEQVDVINDITLPKLVEVEFEADANINLESLTHKLKKIDPTIAVEDHRKWQKNFGRLSLIIQVLGLVIIALVMVAAIWSVIFTTYTGLIIHKDIINILRLIGSKPRYIAYQFQMHTLHLAVKGILASLLSLTVTLFFGRFLVKQIAIYFPLQGVPVFSLITIIVLVPVVVLVVMVLTSRFTVSTALRKMR